MPVSIDQRSVLSQAQSLAPAARTATANGTGVDLAGYASATVLWNVGTITDGTHTPKIQESDDNSSFSDVAAADQVGSLAALASSTPQSCAYIGTKRYLRAVITVTGSPSTGGVYDAAVVRGRPRSV